MTTYEAAAASLLSAAASCARVLLELAHGGGKRSFQLLPGGFLRAHRQGALEELAEGGVEAQPPFFGASRERLLERRGHATVEDLAQCPATLARR